MLGELARLVPRAIAKYVVMPLLRETLLEMYDGDDEEPADSGKPGYDPRGTIAADTHVAANMDHQVIDVLAERRFGFQSGRADERKDRDGTAQAAGRPPWGVS